MGRHLWRLVRPDFAKKMMRSKAPNLYGWDIILRGTLWPGTIIGQKLGHIMRTTAESGHEIGLHTWDHYQWQTHIDRMNQKAISDSLNKGFELLSLAAGKPPVCSAVPAWKCNDHVIQEKSKFPFKYNSDCRGKSIFYPVIHCNEGNGGNVVSQPQIPVTLPTYDEVIGNKGISDNNYNEYILSLIKPDQLNVLTIHAEVEGIARTSLFERFIQMAEAKEVTFIPLGGFLKKGMPIDSASIIPGAIVGREGWISCQEIKKEML